MITLAFLLLIDFFLFPSIAWLPHYFLAGMEVSRIPLAWLKGLDLLQSWQLVLHDPRTQKIWLVLQPLLLVFIVSFFWREIPANTRNNGVGGPPAAGNGQYGSSRFQTLKELSKTMIVWPMGTVSDRGGLVLGANTKKKTAWVVGDDLHALIIGTTRSGKSRRVVLPTIWQMAHAGESMVLSDVKGELYDLSASYLNKMGYNVVYLDFRKPGRGNRWNPLAPIVDALHQGDTARAAQQAWSMAHMFAHQKPGSEKGEPIWLDGAESVIAALALAVATEAPDDAQKHMTSAYKMLAELGEPVKVRVGNAIVDHVPLNAYFTSLPKDHPARDAFATARLAPDRTRGSFYTNVSSLLRLFSDPSIAYLTAHQDHVLANVGKEKTAVFLMVPDEDKTRHTLAALYVDQTYQALVELANENGRRLPVRVNFLLDEFGQLPPIKDFDSKITVSGGRGIRWNLIVQNLQQLKASYPYTHGTIEDSCHLWVYLLTNSLETMREISQKCGSYTIETTNTSTTIRSNDLSKGLSSGLARRELLTPDEVRRWPQEFSLVIPSRQYPAKVPLPDLSHWPANDDFTPFGGDEPRMIEKVPLYIPNVADSVDDEEAFENEEAI
ncbi:VirD4-like conjugal transfer protein, CD1115 family [Paenibacillus humicola]|uniref:VirD4-like conjugal transfer protein, CD1115 family n=1 Tax=Paenibacillus humicola TaxID=3110540 RepID=UPI00237ACE5B|nr:type IV secretory system conjugative DNA transfer family protein [Paenibacillus humicola]